MPQRNSQRHAAYNAHQQQPPPGLPTSQHTISQQQPSDYEHKAPLNHYLQDDQLSMAAAATTAPQPTRTNEELNLTVLHRYNPAIISILSLAPFAVVYLFSATTQQWEKTGIEGSLFVCQLTQGDLGEERYCVLVLNRRGLDNFEAHLLSGDDVELTDEYTILKVDGRPGAQNDGAIRDANGRVSKIYGLWIFSEPPPSSTAETRTLNAQIIKECAVHGGESRKFALERLTAETQTQNTAQQEAVAAEESVPMNRQISLKELFGQQRAQDDEWSVKMHSPGHAPQHPQFPSQPGGFHPGGNPNSGNDVLGDLFRKAGLGYQGNP